MSGRVGRVAVKKLCDRSRGWLELELLFRFNSWVDCGEVVNFDWIGWEVAVGRIDIVGRQLDLGLVGVEVGTESRCPTQHRDSVAAKSLAFGRSWSLGT